MISVSVCSSRRQNNDLLFLAYKKRKASDYKWPSHRDTAGQWVAEPEVMTFPVEHEVSPLQCTAFMMK